MTNKLGKKIFILIAIFTIIELLSFLSVFSPLVAYLSFGIIALVTLILTTYKLEYGLLIVFAELFIGSLGHLFYIPVFNHLLSIRMALWFIVLLVFIIKFSRQLIIDKKNSIYYQNLKKFSNWKIIGAFFFFIILGLVNAYWHHNNLNFILSDFNAWLYFLLIIPALAIYVPGDKKVLEKLKIVFGASAIFLSLETLFLLFIFSHPSFLSSSVYFWLRRTILGEVTSLNGGWPRIFIQGEIFSIIAFFLVFWFETINLKFKKIFQKKSLIILLLATSFLAVLFLSFSRSFWVGFLGALIFTLILIWYKFGLKRMFQALLWFLGVSILSVALIYLVSAWPYYHKKNNNFSQSILIRVADNQGAAISSRWSLLPVLTSAASQEPFFGKGFGSTVSYFSADPRVLEKNPSGKYTTSAFEWGYLGLILKIGVLGLAIYLLLLLKLVIDGLNLAFRTKDYLFFALPTGIIFLALTNIFTPYLNHPLGIGFLIISTCLIWSNRVY